MKKYADTDSKGNVYVKVIEYGYDLKEMGLDPSQRKVEETLVAILTFPKEIVDKQSKEWKEIMQFGWHGISGIFLGFDKQGKEKRTVLFSMMGDIDPATDTYGDNSPYHLDTRTKEVTDSNGVCTEYTRTPIPTGVQFRYTEPMLVRKRNKEWEQEMERYQQTL